MTTKHLDQICKLTEMAMAAADPFEFVASLSPAQKYQYRAVLPEVMANLVVLS